MLICQFYLFVILEIMGAAILATQVLGDWKEKQRQDRILRQSGLHLYEKDIGKLLPVACDNGQRLDRAGRMDIHA